MSIVVRMTGGLGNQLFQYATGRYLAWKNQTELVLEDSFYFDVPPGSTPRAFELEQYDLPARRSTAQERHAYRTYTGRIWKRLRRSLPLPGALRYVHEPLHGQFPAVRDAGDEVFLDGYWQSERYFEGIGEVLRQELQPALAWSAQDSEMAARMAAVESVSVHVRRGDYVTNPVANAMHGVCGVPYYQAAADHMMKLLGQPVFFIFSDDPEWARSNLNLPAECVYVTHNTSAVQDLRLMSSCRHHIIANSTFSWWGAWLNSSATKIVVRPREWSAGMPELGDWTCPAQWTAM